MKNQKLIEFKDNFQNSLPNWTPAFYTNMVAKSTTGSALLDQVDGIEFDDQLRESVTKDGKLFINTTQHIADIMIDIIKLSRMAMNAKRGLYHNIYELDPEDAILFRRSFTFDALAHVIKTAWEMNLAGERDFWNHLMKRMSGQARPFEQVVQKDFRKLNNGEAMRLMYDYFYSNAVLRQVDKCLIHELLLNEKYMVATDDKKLSIDYFNKLGESTHGRNYFGHGLSIYPMDPSYKAIEDRSNANFIWFIKFEKSFHAAALENEK